MLRLRMFMDFWNLSLGARDLWEEITGSTIGDSPQ